MMYRNTLSTGIPELGCGPRGTISRNYPASFEDVNAESSKSPPQLHIRFTSKTGLHVLLIKFSYAVRIMLPFLYVPYSD